VRNPLFYVFFLVFAGRILYNDTAKVMTGRVAFIQGEEREWLGEILMRKKRTWPWNRFSE